MFLEVPFKTSCLKDSINQTLKSIVALNFYVKLNVFSLCNHGTHGSHGEQKVF